MNVSILDDDTTCTQHLKNYLSKWAINHNIPLNITCYNNGESLLKDNFQDKKIIFIDIELPDIIGIDVAKKLRLLSYQEHIIFLTAHNEYVFDGYHVRALDYLVKPITSNLLETSLQPILHELKSSNHILQTRSTIEKIPYSTIIAFSTDGHYIDIITTKETYHQKNSLKALYEILPSNFIQCHRTLIININHAIKITKTEIYLDNQSVYPISKKHLKKIQDSFINCIS